MSKEQEIIERRGRAQVIEKLMADRERAAGDCWEWTGPKYRRGGYGRIVFWKICVRTHRLAFVLFKEPIDAGNVIDHKCRNRACFNPAHLRQVSIATNTMENSESLPARNKAKADCINGHPLSGENLYLYRCNGKAYRYCRECRRLGSRRQYARKTGRSA